MTLHRKHILLLGPLKHPSYDRKFVITKDFVETLHRNIYRGVADYVPVVLYGNQDPMSEVGQVKGLMVEDNKVFAVFDLDADLDLKTYDAYPLMHLSYTDYRSGDLVGPTLYHVMLKPKPVRPADSKTGCEWHEGGGYGYVWDCRQCNPNLGKP